MDMDAWDRQFALSAEAHALRDRLRRRVQELDELSVLRGGRFGNPITYAQYQKAKRILRLASFRAYRRKYDLHEIEYAIEVGS